MEKMEIAVTIRDGGELASSDSVEIKHPSKLSLILYMTQKIGVDDKKKLVHSVKVGAALVLASLLYLVHPLYRQVGDNAMWAVMTVVVVFEFSAGATLSKGLNRTMGTLIGGGLGCLAALLARESGDITSAVSIGLLVFAVGAAATYTRLIPKIKKKYDYGALIFILTFNLVAISGIRSEDIIEIARDRLLTIVVGFAICLLMSFFVFPIWAGNELHSSLITKFDTLSMLIEECLNEYFKLDGEKENSGIAAISRGCRSIMYTKSTDESLANFARWEPWHGKAWFCYPWDKYLRTGELLREMSAYIYTMTGHLHSLNKGSPHPLKLAAKETCEALGGWLSSTLIELRNSLSDMYRYTLPGSTITELHSTRQKLGKVIADFKVTEMEDQHATLGNELVISFVFMLIDLSKEVEEMAREVEELGDLAGFLPRKLVLTTVEDLPRL